jgi:hypothetical protein
LARARRPRLFQRGQLRRRHQGAGCSLALVVEVVDALPDDAARGLLALGQFEAGLLQLPDRLR